MSNTQFAFGLFSGVLLTTLGFIGITFEIYDASLMIVGVMLFSVNLGYWLMQQSKLRFIPIPSSKKIFNSHNYNAD